MLGGGFHSSSHPHPRVALVNGTMRHYPCIRRASLGLLMIHPNAAVLPASLALAEIQAERIGLINHIVCPLETMPKTIELAYRLDKANLQQAPA